jgi:ribosomal protein S18 acetylase RimI-like enzyme
MTMQFVPIQVSRDRETATAFRRDSFYVSFGTDEEFDEGAYLSWLAEKIRRFPDGFVFACEGNEPIGQMELTVKTEKGQRFGYVNLFYLIAEKRGRGLGCRLQDYATAFFRSHGLSHYELRVSSSNRRAIAFYRKNGMVPLYREFGGRVIRMGGEVPALPQ